MSEATHRRLAPEDLYRFVSLSDPRISPDGELIAVVRTHTDKESKELRSAIWTVPAAGGRMVQFTRGPKTDSSPRWSPDGRTLAFVSDRSGEKQIWLIDRYGGEARQLTTMRTGAAGPVWSPDGSSIAFVSAVGPEDKRELLTRPRTDAEKKADEKRAKEEARAFTLIHWRADATGIRTDRRSQIWVVNVPPPGDPLPAPVQVTWGAFDHANPHWSPDGQVIAFDAKRDEDEHGRYTDVYITRAPTEGASACRAVLPPTVPGAETPGEEAAGPCADAAREAEECFACTRVTASNGYFKNAGFSPDGSVLAVIGNERQLGYQTQDSIYLLPVAGGEPRVLDNWDLYIGNSVGADVRTGADGVEVTWAPDGNVIYAPVNDRGTCGVYGWPVVGGRPQPIATGEREIFAGSFDQNCETLAFVAGDMFTIADLHVMDCREFSEQRLTDMNGKLFAEFELPSVEELTFRSPDGQEIHGWLMKPVGFEPGRQYPLVLEIHGGPFSCYGHSFYQEFHVLAAAGYGVLFTNPRGSTSYGQEFVAAHRGRYTEIDVEDLMAAVDHALAFDWVDPKRLGVTGGSYGGFMTNWIVTHSDRFAAAISHRSISNWISFAGTPDFGPFFDMDQHLVDDPWSPEGVERLWSISPLTYVKNVKTPISLMHSEFDYRCPIEQAEQFYMAIKFYKRAPTELVRHPRSNHDLTRQGPPALRVDRFHRILKWFGRYCPANAK